MVSISTALELSWLSFPNVNEETVIEQADSLLDSTTTDWESLTPGSISLHRLTPVYTLAYAHHLSGKEEYLACALEIANSWAKYSAEATDPNPYTWHGFSTTGRMSALLFLSILQGEKDETAWLTYLIRKHVHFLMQQENYLPKQTRGILMDIVLIVAGVYLGESEAQSLGISRLKEQLTYVLPAMAAHQRNSAMHNFDTVMSLYPFMQILEQVGLLELVQQYINGALTFITHSISPLAEMPATGDSPTFFFSPTAGDLQKYTEMGTGGLGLAYAISQGMSGNMPQETAKVYPADGHAFFRSSWANGDMASWLCLKSGFATDEHKHMDELSVILAAKGVNIFVEPGASDTNDIFSEYLQSPFAHSGIIVDNTPYPINDYSKAGMFDMKEIAGFPCARAFNNLYQGVYIDRTVIHTDENTFCIVDDIYSNESHQYTQNFHLGADIRLVAHTPQGSVLQLPGGWCACILQYSPADNAQAKQGKTNDIRTMSICSTAHGTVQDTISIQYTKNGKSTRFVTVINILPEAQLNSLLSSPTPLNGDTLLIGGKSIDISPRKRAFPVKIAAACNSGRLEITHGDATGEFVYQLIKKQTGEIAAEVQGTSLLPPEGEYVILAHRRTGPEAVKWCAGEIAIYNNLFNFKPTLPIASVPYVKRRMAHSSSGNRYIYELIMAHHQYPYNVMWEVTKDGKLYHQAIGGRMLTLHVTEPGIYVCNYVVSTQYFGLVENSYFAPVAFG